MRKFFFLSLFMNFFIFPNSYSSSVPQNNLQLDRFQSLGIRLDDWSEGQIQFWSKVYVDYTTQDSIIHDSANLKRIYQVVGKGGESKAKHDIHVQLLSIYEKNKNRKSVDIDQLNVDEERYYEVHESNEDPRAYQFASDPERIRTQVGQRDRLENAYAISTRYLKRMEEIFIEEGVPRELTRLPFVESVFVKDARSSVGAIGVWQFMTKTAEKQLKVSSLVDERYDPLKSTRAAAKYLKQNYQLLHSWALAIMAYHHGPGLVNKAVKRLHTHDPIRIIKEFKDGSFKFASRNYLFEFLAMLDVDRMHALFFKNIDLAPLPPYITVSFQKKMLMKTILERYKLKEDLTHVLNPHLLTPIWNGQAALPAHYPIRLTGITLEEFNKAQYK